MHVNPVVKKIREEYPACPSGLGFVQDDFG